MESPLVNGYKRSFILRRLLETFTGGLRLSHPYPTPIYPYLIQIALYLIFPVICGVFLYLNILGSVSRIPACFTCGSSLFLYSFFLQVVALFFQRRKSKSKDQENFTPADEEIFHFDSSFGPNTWSFLIPPKKWSANIFFHSILFGLLGGLAIYYLDLKATESLQVDFKIQISFLVLGLVTFSIGVWPLVVGSPPEPATFNQLPYDLDNLSRALHILLCILVHFLSSMWVDNVWLMWGNVIAHVLFVCCPLLWVLGILPPIDAFVLWILERWLFLILGGSPTSSNMRLLEEFLIGTSSLLVMAALPGFLSLCIVAPLRGYLLSLDWSLLMGLFCVAKQSSVGTFSQINEIRRAASISAQSSLSSEDYTKRGLIRRRNILKESIFFGLLFIFVSGISLGINIPHSDWYNMVNSSHIPPSYRNEDSAIRRPYFFKMQLNHILGFCVCLLSLSTLVLNSLQKVFIFSVIRNPFYIKGVSSSNTAFYFLSQSIQFGGPFVSLLFLSCIFGVEFKKHFSSNFLEAFWLIVIPFGFCYRQVWQFPSRTILLQSVYFLVELIGRQFWSGPRGWFSLPSCLRLHLISLVLLFLYSIYEKFKTIFIISLTSLLEPKMRKTINYFIVGANIALAPLLFIAIVISTVFLLPLLPLFTLPLFLLGFPRPQRFWSYPVGFSANKCSDTAYYEQLAPHLVARIHCASLSGKLGIVEPGDMYILRWEDRFVWLHILEVGFGYTIYSMKGLELQETSCHTTEALRVDSIFSQAFEKSKGRFFNPYLFHSLTALTQISTLCYSDTKNVLTGVIESPETRSVIKDYFSKAVLYFLAEFICKRDSSNLIEVSRAKTKVSDNIKSESRISQTSLGSERPKITKSRSAVFSHLPKAEKSSSAASVQRENKDAAREKSVPHSSQTSRVAWTSDGKESPQKSSPIDGNNSKNMKLRPCSWNDEEDPLETTLKTHSLSSSMRASLENSSAKKTVLPPLSSKAKSYVPSQEDFVDIDNILNLPGKMYESSSDSEDNAITQFPYHLESSGSQSTSNKKNTAKVNLRVLSSEHVSRQPLYGTLLSKAMAPSSDWLSQLPYDEDLLEEMQACFPLCWYKHVMVHFGRLKFDSISCIHQNAFSSFPKDVLVDQLKDDESLEESFRMLVAICEIIVFGGDFGPPTPNHIFRIFCADIPWSTGLDWIAEKKDFFLILLKSFRVAVKLSLDHTLIGPLDRGWSELQESLEEYSSAWYIGPDFSTPHKLLNEAMLAEFGFAEQWENAIRREVPNLFSLGYDETKKVFTSHLLTLGEVEVNIGKLDSETVFALWSSLLTELLYLTNDDDERYSIQAHPVILRNLTIQAADPPLGYPIYSSRDEVMSLPWLTSPKLN